MLATAIVLIVLAAVLFLVSGACADDGVTCVGAFLLACVAIVAGCLLLHSYGKRSVSGVYATSSSVQNGTYLVRGQFEDPLKAKVVLLQGSDGKIRAVRIKEFLPPETKAVEVGDASEPLPLKDPS